MTTTRTHGSRSAVERLEDLEWMATHGESLTGAAHRLGSSPKAISRFLYRNNQRDLHARLVAAENHNTRRNTSTRSTP